MINRIELVAFYQTREMRDFNRNDSVRLQEELQTFDEIVQVRHMRQDIVGHDEIRTLPTGG